MNRYCIKIAEQPEDMEPLLNPPEGVLIDIIGEIDGVDGWHLNMMCDELPEDLKPYEVFPDSPVRVWL